MPVTPLAAFLSTLGGKDFRGAMQTSCQAGPSVVFTGAASEFLGQPLSEFVDLCLEGGIDLGERVEPCEQIASGG